MIKVPKFFISTVVIIICQITIMSCAFANDRTFRGKVVDFDTKEPIEGVAVVAYWDKARAMIAGESTILKEVKEILTDKKGEWSIIGEEGEPHDPLPYLSLFIPYTKHPSFIIFKPGYESFKDGWGATFLAYTYVDKKRNLEGLVLEIAEKERAYFQKYRKNDHSKVYMVNGQPFIPTKESGTKLKNVDIPFDYPDDIRRLIIKGEEFFYFKNYTVIGLKKLKTREERLKAMPSPEGEFSDRKKQRRFIQLINAERKKLGLTGEYNIED
jgi:hypothetical protein